MWRYVKYEDITQPEALLIRRTALKTPFNIYKEPEVDYFEEKIKIKKKLDKTTTSD